MSCTAYILRSQATETCEGLLRGQPAAAYLIVCLLITTVRWPAQSGSLDLRIVLCIVPLRCSACEPGLREGKRQQQIATMQSSREEAVLAALMHSSQLCVISSFLKLQLTVVMKLPPKCCCSLQLRCMGRYEGNLIVVCPSLVTLRDAMLTGLD